MAKDLRKLFEKEFATIMKAADENLAEAKENLDNATDELQKKQQIVEALQETVVATKSVFRRDAKLLFGIPGREVATLEDLKKISENLNAHVSATEELPNAHVEVEVAAQKYDDANAEYAQACHEKSLLANFIV